MVNYDKHTEQKIFWHRKNDSECVVPIGVLGNLEVVWKRLHPGDWGHGTHPSCRSCLQVDQIQHDFVKNVWKHDAEWRHCQTLARLISELKLTPLGKGVHMLGVLHSCSCAYRELLCWGFSVFSYHFFQGIPWHAYIWQPRALVVFRCFVFRCHGMLGIMSSFLWWCHASCSWPELSCVHLWACSTCKKLNPYSQICDDSCWPISKPLSRDKSTNLCAWGGTPGHRVARKLAPEAAAWNNLLQYTAMKSATLLWASAAKNESSEQNSRTPSRHTTRPARHTLCN